MTRWEWPLAFTKGDGGMYRVIARRCGTLLFVPLLLVAVALVSGCASNGAESPSATTAPPMTSAPTPTVSYSDDEVEIVCGEQMVTTSFLDFEKNAILDLHNFLAGHNEAMLKSSVVYHRVTDPVQTYDEAAGAPNFIASSEAHLTVLDEHLLAIEGEDVSSPRFFSQRGLASSYKGAIYNYWDFERRLASDFRDGAKFRNVGTWNEGVTLSMSGEVDLVDQAFDDAAAEACAYLTSD